MSDRKKMDHSLTVPIRRKMKEYCSPVFNKRGQKKTHPSSSVLLVMESSYALPKNLLRFN